MEDTFSGSLPAFIAAFTQNSKLSKEEALSKELCAQEEAESELLKRKEQEVAMKKSRAIVLQEENESCLKKLENLKQNTSLLLFEDAQKKHIQLKEGIALLSEREQELSLESKNLEKTMMQNKLRLGVLKEQEKHLLKNLFREEKFPGTGLLTKSIFQKL